MDNEKHQRAEIFNDIKDDFRLFGIAFYRLGRNLFRLIKSIELPKIAGFKITAPVKWAFAAIALIFILGILISCIKSCGGSIENIENEDVEVEEFTYVPRVERPEVAHKISNINYRKMFNDMNDAHLGAAKKIGIEPLVSREAVDDASRKLVETNNYDAYVVDELTHSIPFLVPEAADLLQRIGENFQDSLVMKHLPPHKVIVTSVLRTQNDVKRLGKGNVNSSKNSAHCYATTFDITYKRFYSVYGETLENQAKLKLVLGEVLRDLKNEGSCYVKHEVKQACFHVTARKHPKK